MALSLSMLKITTSTEYFEDTALMQVDRKPAECPGRAWLAVPQPAVGCTDTPWFAAADCLTAKSWYVLQYFMQHHSQAT